MIRSIHLLNWRSHSNSKFEFRKGTNLLVGIMGAGKSSVLEGISFALFGTFPALERRKLKLDDIVRLDKKSASVVAEFELEGRIYRAERTIERTKRGTTSSARLFRDDGLLEEGPVAVTTCIQNLISIDYDLFTRAIYSEQNNIDYFLTLDPRRRKEEIDALLGLDKFEIARTNAVSVLNQMRGKREAIEARFSRERVAELENAEKTHGAEAAQAEARLKETATLHGTKSKELAALSTTFEDMRKKRELFERLEKGAIRLSAQQESLQKELEGSTADESVHEAAKKRLPALLSERTKAVDALKALEARNSALSKDLGTTEAKIKTAAEARTRLDALHSETKSLLGGHCADKLHAMQEKLEKAVMDAEAEHCAIEQSITETTELVLKLKPGLSKCPLCSSKLDDTGIAHVKAEKDGIVENGKKRLTELAIQIKSAKKENDEMLVRTRRLSLISDKAASLEGELKAAAGFQDRKKQLEASLAELARERTGIQKRSDELSTDVETLRVELSRSEGILSKHKALLSLQNALTDTRDKLSAIKFDERSFEDLRTSVERLRLEAERAMAEKQAASARLESSKQMLTMVHGELSTLRAMEKGISDFYALEEQLSIYKNALLETQTGLRTTLSEAINTAINEIWPIFYPYRNYHALRLGVTEKDYVFEVNDGDAWKPLETIASGGERACAALTLRVALAMVLTPKLSWLILDEPTHNLDREAVELLSAALQTKVPEAVKQTFVITHDEAFMGSEFASSYRLVRDKERNGETRIEAI